MLKPALRHLSLYIGDNAAAFELHFENLFTAVAACLELNNMFTRSASIIESVYGLQRVANVDGDELSAQNAVPISRKQKVLSVLLSIVLPRVMAILRAKATEINHRRNSRANSANQQLDGSIVAGSSWRVDAAQVVNLAERGFAAVFPYVELGYDLSTVVYQLLYMTGRSVHHHPVFALLGMSLVRKRNIAGAEGAVGGGSVTGSPAGNASSSAPSWPVALVLALILAARTAEYLHRNNDELAGAHLSGRLAGEVPLPPAPEPAPVGRGCVVPPLDASLCALCNRKRTNPCVSTSGYVLCYMCLLPYVREHHKCPVTGVACGELDIIRLYEESAAV
jgi:peroxin-12